MQMMAMSPRLEGVWWLRSPKSNMRLVVSNTGDSTLSATVNIDGIAPRQTSLLTINLASHETRVLSPISLAANGNGTLHKIGGISIRYDGAPGSLLAHGLIDEQSTGFSSSIEFSDPSMAHSSKLNGGGLRLGPAGGKQLTPVVVVRNIGSTESIVAGSMPYTAGDGSTFVVRLPEVRLRPGEVDMIDIARAIRSNRIDVERVKSAGLEFTYSSAPGSILMSAQSLSADGNQVFRLPLIDADAQPSSTGGYPWFINGGSSTVVYITNVTDHPQQYVLQLNFPGGVYAPGLKTVEPNQTAAIDIRALRDGQVKDEHNQTIPLAATHGQVQWSIEGPENLAIIGRAEQADSLKGMSSSYACVNCCPASCAQTWMNPPSISGFSGDTQQFTAFQQNEDCFGNMLQPFAISSATWSSTNSSVATVNTSGLATAQNVGTTNIGANWSAWLWDQNPNKTCFKTHIFPNPTAVCDVGPSPDHVRVVLDEQGYPGTCANTGVYVRRMQMQVVDINDANVTVPFSEQETLSQISTNTCGNGSPIGASCAPAESGGQFGDEMEVSHNVCGSGINRNSGCGYTLTATWSICSGPAASQVPVWSYDGETRSNQIKVNGRSTSYPAGTLLYH